MIGDLGPSRNLVFGGTGLVGGHVVRQLASSGERPFVLSRSQQVVSDAIWLRGDLKLPEALQLPVVSTLYCTADATLLPAALPFIFKASLKRVVVFSSTSVLTKIDSEIPEERAVLSKLAEAERGIVAACSQRGVAWTILRPTLIYEEGRDVNLTPLSRIIKHFGVMPLVGSASGLRQPVHAQDLAIGAIAAARSEAAANKFYSLPGAETLTYREMIGRVFDSLNKPRRFISLPAPVWKAGFAIAKPLLPSYANAAMGTRMMKDMVFDATPAIRDFGWKARRFNPHF